MVSTDHRALTEAGGLRYRVLLQAAFSTVADSKILSCPRSIVISGALAAVMGTISPAAKAGFPADPDILNGIFATVGGEVRNAATNGLIGEATLEVTDGEPVEEAPPSYTYYYEDTSWGDLLTDTFFGTRKIITRGQTDPWAEFRLSMTNVHAIPVTFRFDLRFGINEILGAADVQGILDVSVEDTSGDGSASYTTQYARFEGWNFDEFVFDTYPGSGFTPLLEVQAGQTIRQIDVMGSIDPSIFGGTLYDEMVVGTVGILSPGDTVTLEGFTCLVAPGGSCPMPTLLSSTVPIPAAAWLFGSALIGLFGVSVGQRRSRA